MRLFIAADHGLVELEKPRGALGAELERLRQRLAEERVDALQDRVVGAAGEAAVLLVADAERQEGGLLELEGVVLSPAGRPVPARSRAMRMTSSDFSRRLCAFSVFSARIL